MPRRSEPPGAQMRGDLVRLIEALDRRVPRLERAGEATIAGQATELRARAVALLRVLQEAEAGGGPLTRSSGEPRSPE